MQFVLDSNSQAWVNPLLGRGGEFFTAHSHNGLFQNKNPHPSTDGKIF